MNIHLVSRLFITSDEAARQRFLESEEERSELPYPVFTAERSVFAASTEESTYTL